MIVMVTGPSTCNYFLIYQRVRYWHTEMGDPITLLVMDGDGNPNHDGAGGRGGRAAKELGIETVAEIDGMTVGDVDLVIGFFESEKELGKSDTVREALARGVAVEVAMRSGIRFPYTTE